ncbi:MAG: tRNA1(Val) (adenine(37)-N6)-methyltransferase [Pseudomonadota bacterium]
MTHPVPPLPEGLSENRFLGGQVTLRQPRRGYRAGMDAALLAAACDAAPGERVLEAGCGVGGALLAAAVRRPEAVFVGVERDGQALELARQNIEINGLGDRVSVRAGEVAEPFVRLGLPPFDLAMANPPFFDDPEALRAPAPEKAGAWMADDGFSAWAAFLLKAVRPGGRILVIHRADRLADLLGALAAGAGSIQIRPVHPFADAPAKRVLVRAVKTGRAPLRLLPPVVLHPRSGEDKHTAEAEAILRGAAAIDWAAP